MVDYLDNEPDVAQSRKFIRGAREPTGLARITKNTYAWLSSEQSR